MPCHCLKVSYKLHCQLLITQVSVRLDLQQSKSAFGTHGLFTQLSFPVIVAQ